jgi:adenylate kinase family enzyme
MRRVSVVGISGSGKSTLAERIAAALGVPRLELDAVNWHAPGWQPIGREPFREAVERFTAGEAWVVDGNYSSMVQDIVWGRADTVVWLDLSRPVVMWQLVRRTLSRLVRRTELWNGNRERWRSLLSADDSIIHYAWTHHGPTRRRYTAAFADPAWAHLRLIRLCTRAAVRRFLDAL